MTRSPFLHFTKAILYFDYFSSVDAQEDFGNWLFNLEDKKDKICNRGNYKVSQTKQGHHWGSNYPHGSKSR